MEVNNKTAPVTGQQDQNLLCQCPKTARRAESRQSKRYT